MAGGYCHRHADEACAYWYAVGAEAPLPVFRTRFTDEAHTWACMDTVTAELVGVGGTPVVKPIAGFLTCSTVGT